MANSSFPSLEDSSLVDEIAGELARSPAPMSNFADEYANDELARTSAAARWARKFDPQSYARAEKLAPGIEPERGIRQLELLEDTANLAKYQEVFKNSPTLRGYFAEFPKDLPKATPDDLDNISGLSWLGSAGVAAYNQGYLDIEAAFTSNRVADYRRRGETPLTRDQAFLENYKGGRTFGSDGFWQEAFVQTAQQIGPLLATAAQTFKTGVMGGVGGAAYGSAVPGVGTAVGAISGTAAGSIAGGYSFQQQLQTGLSRLYFQSIRDKDGKPLEPELVEFASQLTGAGGALLESVSLGNIARVIPGSERLTSLLTKEGMKTALSNPTVRGALLEFAKNTASTGTVEIATEVLQQGLQIAAGELAKSESQGNWANLTADEVANELYQAGYQAFQVMALMGPMISSTRFGSDLIEVNRSQREHKALEKTLKDLEGNELLQRDPDLAAKLIDKQLGDQQLYIPSTELVTLFQEQGLDRYGPPLPNWRQRLDEALAVNGDVQISVGEFIAHLSKDPKENPLLALVRTNPEGFNQNELAIYNEAQEALLGSEIAQAEARGKLPADRVTAQPIELFPELEQLKKQIEAIGFDKKAVDSYTTLFAAFFQTMAQRTGKTASELWNEYSVEVRSGLIPAATEPAQNSDTYFQSAWHGSPHEFEQFSIEKLGTGEGAQAFGWGLYFAENKALAQYYQRELSRRQGKGTPEADIYQVGPAKFREHQDSMYPYYQKYADKKPTEEQLAALRAKRDELYDAIPREESGTLYKRHTPEYKAWIDAANELSAATSASKGEIKRIEGKKVGRLFKVTLPDDPELIVMDNTLNEQSEQVKKAITNLKLKKPGLFASGRTKAGYARLQEIIAGKGWEKENGFSFYNLLSMYYGGRGAGGDKMASLTLLREGIPGHKFLDGASRSKGEGTYNFVIYDDGRINVDEYFQENRGSITFADEQAVITLFESHDMSTLLHEAGHFFLQTFRDLAAQSSELAADWETIKSKLKIGDDNLISREQHEQFARWAEAYFMEGKSPSPELKPAFEQFRRWLKTLYKSIQKLGGRVSPEISQVFDRMFVVDDRLEQIALDDAYAPLRLTAEQMGIPIEEYLAYQKLAEELKQDASEKARERIVGQAQRLQRGWMGEIEKQLAQEAEAKLRQQAPYKHMEALRERKLQIDRDALVAKYEESSVEAFPKKGIKKGGLAPEVAAELLGYPSADDMVYDFTQAKPIKEAAKEFAQAEMVKRYGEDYSKPEILDLAIKNQLAQDGRMLLLGKELKILSRKAGKTTSEVGPMQLATEIARNVIYAKKVGEIAQHVTRAAVRRAARMADAAIVKGDWAVAADWKRKQLLAQALDNETEKASRVLDKIRNKAARYSRTTPPSVDPSFMEQIRALVEQYDFARISGKKLKKRINLRDFLAEAEAEGLVVTDIPERLLRDSQKVNYKELTVEDLIGIGDTLDNLEHLGRLKNRLKTKQRAAEFAEVKQQILNVTNSLPQKKVKPDPYGNHKQPVRDWLTAFHASLLKPEQIVEFLDAGQIHGPLAEHVFNPIAEAQNLQNDMNMEYNQKLVGIFEDIPSKYLAESITIPEINNKLTREQIYAAALNTGNSSSRKKLLEGEIWTEQQLSAVLSHMGKEDWDRVQKVWNLLDSLWPKIAALEKRLTGVAPPRIEARAFSTPYGEYEGGYYPAIYDFKIQRGRNLIEDTTPRDRVIGEGLFSNENIRPGTNHKHTVQRTKTAKVMRLELGVLPGHINNVIHDLAYREAIRSAYKVLWDPDIAQSIRKAEGDEVYRQLQHWLRAVATEHSVETGSGQQLIARVRTGATMFGMGYRLTTVVSQVLGFLPAMVRVGATNLMSATYQLATHPYQSWEMVSSLSGEMRHRFNQQERDIKDTVNGLLRSGSKLDTIKGYAFWAIGWVDRGISTAVWMGAYQQQIAKNPSAHEEALRFADRTVRLTQGTGSVKDMAKIMNDGELMKLFTMFYSFFSAQYNMQVDLTRKTKRDIAAGDMNRIFMERIPQWIYLVPLPAILGGLISGQGPEEDENWAWWATKQTAMYPLAAIPFVRDIIGSAESGFGYKFTPAAKAFDSTVTAARELGDLVTNREEFDPAKFAKSGASAASIAMKLPAGQAINTVEGLWKGLENGDFEPQDLMYGRRGK